MVSEQKHPRARILREELGSRSIRGVFALPLTKLDASPLPLHTAQCGWHRPVTLALGRWSHREQEFKAIFSY